MAGRGTNGAGGRSRAHASPHATCLDQVAIERKRRQEQEEREEKEAAERRRRVKAVKSLVLHAEEDEVAEMDKIAAEVDSASWAKGGVAGVEDAHGAGLLSIAANANAVGVIKLLVDKYDVDRNQKDNLGRTPLYRAVFGGHADATRLLLAAGGDPRVGERSGELPAEVAFVDDVKALLSEWDTAKTDAALGAWQARQRKREDEAGRLLRAKKDMLASRTETARRENEARQKEMRHLRCELNKRIREYDEVVGEGKGAHVEELAMQSVKDAERQEEQGRKLLKESNAKLNQALKEEEDADGERKVGPGGLPIPLQQLEDRIIHQYRPGKWFYVSDPSSRAAMYLKYRDTNYVNVCVEESVTRDSLRLALLGALRYGKLLVVDMMELDFFEEVGDYFNAIRDGLWAELLDGSLLRGAGERYLSLVKESDSDAYAESNWQDLRTKRFRFVLLSERRDIAEAVERQMEIVTVASFSKES